MNKIWLSPPFLSGKEKLYVSQAIESNWVAPGGPFVDLLEDNIKSYAHVDHCVAVSSGTAAIHLALLALGVQCGDVVICPSFTFAATAFPITYCNAEPVFVDSEPQTWCMDPDLVEEAIKKESARGKNVKAIIVVHIYGQPARMDELLAIGQTYDIPIIEDAAEAMGSDYKGKPAGSMGQIGTYSFNGNKLITCSGGGAVLTKDRALSDKMRLLANQAYVKGYWYQHEEVGYNYRMSNILAAVGVAQLENIDDRIKAKRAIYDIYREEFSDDEVVQFQPEISETKSNRWLTTVLTDLAVYDLKMVVERLSAAQIESRYLMKPMHMQKAFTNARYYGGQVCEELFSKGLCLPSGIGLKVDDIKRVVGIFKSCRQ